MLNSKLLFIFTLLLFVFSYQCVANTSAVILQYHNVSETTPASTSITPKTFRTHLDWLKDNDFSVLPLQEIVESLQAQKSLPASKVVALTFDDTHHSVCDTAWPILKEYDLPFTLFINTEAVDRGFQSQCTWSQLKEITQSGLMTPANHSHQHLNMVSNDLLMNKAEWPSLVTKEITKAQALIKENLGQASKLFAYPYGEYNSKLEDIVKELDFIGFGQHSGAIGFHSDFIALPRFPASGTFANLETLSVKLYSRAFPAQISPSIDNPINLTSAQNPPRLIIKPTKAGLIKNINCFNGKGQPIDTRIEQDHLIVQSPDTLTAGRHRYTCTSQSDQAGRFYWISHQWLVEENSTN